jgi:hypothetical protein
MISTAATTRHFSAAILPPSARPFEVGPGSPWESLPTRAGTLRLAVSPCRGEECLLHVIGSDGPATLMTTDGRVERGLTLHPQGAGGLLLVAHSAEPLLVFFGPEDEPALGLWHGLDRAAAEPVTLPARLGLDGGLAVLGFETDGDSLLAMSCDRPALFRLASDHGVDSWVALAGGSGHRLLPAGRAELSVRALGGGELGHELELSATAITAIGEGLGPEVLLGPGSGRAFVFSVAEAGPVGVGARADPDRLDCRLLAADGRVVGDGIVQMHELEAGGYLLLLKAPGDGGPVLAQPAVVGIERPPTGPPEDVIRRYLEMEGVQP